MGEPLSRASTDREKSPHHSLHHSNLLGGAKGAGNAADFHFLSIPPHEKFNQASVRKIIETTVNEFVEGLVYSSVHAVEWAQDLSVKIMKKISQLDLKRYKIIITVLFAEQSGSGLHQAMRCLWDTEADSYSTFSITNDTLHCVVTVCGINTF